MPNNISFVFAAFAIAWVLICAYLIFLNGRIGGLRQDVEALRDELDTRLGGADGTGARPE